MKELVCTICESVTHLNLDYAIKRNLSEQINNFGEDKYPKHGDNSKYASENDYIQSCQVNSLTKINILLFGLLKT